MEMQDVLFYFSCKYEGDYEKMVDAIIRKEEVDNNKLNIYKSFVTSNYITLLDNEYPLSLKTIYQPPLVLFYKGDISLLKEKNMISVVGSRKYSEYGKDMCIKICKGLVNSGYGIVSGLAKGIDAIALSTCIENNGKAVGVLGSGLNNFYPACNNGLYEKICRQGLVISEYPDFVEAKKEHFPLRNRILVGLGLSLFVPQCQKRSGSMISISYALEQGKDVFCIPYRIDEENACNTLIKEGARLVEEASDIVDEYKF